MIKPLGDRIFIKKDEQLNKIGHIILAKKEGMHAPPYSGLITGIGLDVVDNEYQIGMKIIFHDLAGVEYKYKGNTIFSLREKDITAIIDKNVQIV